MEDIIKDEDIKIVIKESVLSDLRSAVEIANRIEKMREFDFDDPTWIANTRLAYIYQLGIIVGKRKERERRKQTLGILRKQAQLLEKVDFLANEISKSQAVGNLKGVAINE